jgi:hypothetical protein
MLTPEQFTTLDVLRFWSKVNKDGPTMPHMDTNCWERVGKTSKTNHYRHFLSSDGTNRGAHRVGYVLQNGDLEDHLLVMHLCDYRPCVRGDHLGKGTNAENSADMVAKGRWNNKPKIA